MKSKWYLLVILLSISVSSCNLRKIAELPLSPDTNTRQERNEEKITHEEADRQVKMYWVITTYNVNNVKGYLKEGYDPNRSMGDEGWMVKTPLNVIARSLYDTYTRIKWDEEIPDPPPDVAMLRLLVDAGADVNQRPYIWCRIYTLDQFLVEHRLRRNILVRIGRSPETEAEIEALAIQRIEMAKSLVNDSNRVIEAFLKAGADPDMRGHPYPYSLEAKRKHITDEEADEYFAKGTRPINEAIKKGIRWESQVDLLLQYTTLDKDSLKAAKESKDKDMIKKIEKLWEEQNARKD